MNKLIKQVDSINFGVSSSHNELVVTFQTYYSTFSNNVEKSYDACCRNVISILTYFLKKEVNILVLDSIGMCPWQLLCIVCALLSPIPPLIRGYFY